MQVRVLGQIEASEGKPHLLGGPTQRRVFAALVARRGEAVSVPELVEICWPGDDTPDRAEHNVRSYVHRLRTALGDDGIRIETASAGYRLHLDRSELDLDQFADLAAAAARLIDTGDIAEALELIDEADALWRGRPYGEFADEPWAMAEAARLTELRCSTNEQRAEALLVAGRAADAVVRLESMIHDEPLRERPRALLMRALYESGRQAEALRAFQSFRRMLVDEVGVEPSPDLIELDREIASGGLESSTSRSRVVRGYRIAERLGEGAFSIVYRGTQPAVGRDVAIKQIRAELANRPDFIRRFEAEAHMVANLEHPYIVPLYDYWREPGSAYLVMRLLSGGSLESSLLNGPWDLAKTSRLVEQIGAALSVAHRSGVVHRDVKPANILLDDDGNSYLTDFGIALDESELADPTASLSAGSPAYASPEQLRREPVGPSADVHGLAIAVYEALVGRLPFPDEPNQAALLQRQLHDPIPTVRSTRSDLPSAVDDVLQRATAKRSTDRYQTIEEFVTAFETATGASTVIPARGSATVIRAEARNPFKGLRAFDETDAADFAGRDRLVDQLLTGLGDNRILAVVGPSGSGKSSVVRAGLLPALRRGAVPGSSDWFVSTLMPGAHPHEELEAALLRVATERPPGLLEVLNDGDRGISRALRQVLPENGQLLLVIDQFEEVFTLCQDEAERRRFLDGLAAAITEERSRLHVILTLRADFYDRPLRYESIGRLVRDATIAVLPLAADELERAIVEPAHSVGTEYEPGLVSEIMADVNDQPGALPLLQYALTELWERQISGLLTRDAYRQLGGVTGALARQAEELFAKSSPEQQDATQRLFGRLVTLGEGTEDTRRRVSRSELGEGSAIDPAIDRFGRAHLLSFDRDPATREPTIEVAHEALLREWPRLRTWLDEDRDGLRIHRHLTDTTQAWVSSDRDAGELYRGARLDSAAGWVAEHGDDLNKTEREFLDASVSQRDAELAAEREHLEQQVRSNRRLRVLVGVATVIAVVAGVAGVFALQQRSRADDEAAAAQTRAAEAESAQQRADTNAADAQRQKDAATESEQLASDLALENETRALEAEAARAQGDLERLRAAALATAPERPVVATLLAVEAQRIDPSIESLDALHRVLTAVPGMKGAVPASRYSEAELLDDETTMIAVGETLDVWDISRRTLLRSIPIPTPSRLPILDVAGDGQTAAVGIGVTEVAVVDLATGDVNGTFVTEAIVNDVSLSSDGSLVAVAQDDGLVTLWGAGDLDLRATLDSGEPSVNFARWNPVGNSLSVVTSISAVQVWDAATLEMRWSSTPPDGPLGALSATPTGVLHSSDGTLVVIDSGNLSPVLRTYQTSDGVQPYLPTGRTDGANGIDAMIWIDEEHLHLGAGSSKGVATYDLTTGDQVGEFIGELNVQDLVHSPSRREVVSVGSDRLQFRSTIGAGPLERVALLSDAQRDVVVRDGGTVHTSISDNGSRLIVSALGGGSVPPTTSFDLTTEPMTVGDFPFDDRLAFGNGAYTATVGLMPLQIELLDESDQPLATIPITFDTIDQDVSADGRFIATGRVGGLVDLYDGSGKLLRTLDMELDDSDPGSIVIPSLTDDGNFVMAVAGAGSNAIWSTDTYERIDDGSFVGQSRLVADMLVNRSRNNIQLYQLPGLAPIGPVMIHESGGQFYPAIDPVGQRLAVTAQDTVTVYDIATGLQIGRALPYRPIRIEFSGDGTQLAVASDDRVTVWNYDTDLWTEIACQTTGRNLSREEWDQYGPRTIEYRATCPQFPIES